MQEYTIYRTDGRRPLRFEGELLASASNRLVGEKEQTRWWEARVYKSASGKYVFESRYITLWEGEQKSTTADVFSSLDELITAIEKCEALTPQLKSDLLAQLEAYETV